LAPMANMQVSTTSSWQWNFSFFLPSTHSGIRSVFLFLLFVPSLRMMRAGTSLSWMAVLLLVTRRGSGAEARECRVGGACWMNTTIRLFFLFASSPAAHYRIQFRALADCVESNGSAPPPISRRILGLGCMSQS
jgi:hypothetical protein